MEQRKITLEANLETRKIGETKILEGYFIKFNDPTELYRDTFEQVSPEAVVKSLTTNDIKCLFNHDAAIVLGRTGNKTLELRQDDVGVYGTLYINEEDREALDIYSRVKRGDINKCSFGFNILDEKVEHRNGGYLYTLKDIDLHEVSIVTFPAYDNTGIEARKKQRKQLPKIDLVERSNETYLKYSDLLNSESKGIEKRQVVAYSIDELESLEQYPKNGLTSLRLYALEGALKRELELINIKQDNLRSKGLKQLQRCKQANSDDELEDSRKSLESILKEIEESTSEAIEKEVMIERTKATIRKSKQPSQPKGENKKMENLEQRKNLEAFIRSKGEIREGLKMVSSDVILEDSLIKDDSLKVRTHINLEAGVNVHKVSTQAGATPILKESTAVLHTVEELEANPSLAMPELISVDWKVATYRGSLPISQEAIEDGALPVVNLVLEAAQEQVRNTRNKAIADVYKTFTPKTVSNTDELKDILNVDLSAGYSPSMVVSQSFFNVIDKLKDENGHYLYKNGKFNDLPVVKVPDTMLGVAGSKVAFIGDTYRAVFLADRYQMMLTYVDHNVYGKHITAVTRFQAKKADENAGFFVTWTEAGA